MTGPDGIRQHAHRGRLLPVARPQLAAALRTLLALSVLCGLAYPLAATGAAQVLFGHRANGSLLERDGTVVGSSLLGQAFESPGWFQPRPSAAGDGYDGGASGASNLGPTNDALLAEVQERAAAYRTANGLPMTAKVPVDAVTASGSGLDPHISVANARLQARRVARERGGGPAPGDRVFLPLERAVYRIAGLGSRPGQRWTAYAGSMLAFSLVSTLGLYLMLRTQRWLPLNPTGMDNLPPALAFNTAVSFVTGTNWQAYAGESTMSYFSQMAGLVVAQFTAAGVGMGVALALIRGLARRSGPLLLGNFWTDLVRTIARVLLPIAAVATLVLVSQGVVQNLNGFTQAATVTGGIQQVPGGLAATQEVLKTLGTNGGGFYNANSAHPFENPNGFTNLTELYLVLLLPFAIPLMYGRMVGDRRQGRAILTVMALLWLAPTLVAMYAETNGNPRLDGAADQAVTAVQPGGNLEGKEVRLGPGGSALLATGTMGTSAGVASSALDSYTPVGGLTALGPILLGEVSPGGVGSGLYAMLIYVLLAVFIAGLMIGRTPQYLGKKISTQQTTLVALYLLVLPLVILGFSAASVLLPTALNAPLNPGSHGFTEVVYAFASAANGNGSAFAGLSANTDWYNTTLGLAMLAGRYLTIVPILALAGSLARVRVEATSAANLSTHGPVFVTFQLAVVLLFGGLCYLPMLMLGLIGESLL